MSSWYIKDFTWSNVISAATNAFHWFLLLCIISEDLREIFLYSSTRDQIQIPFLFDLLFRNNQFWIIFVFSEFVFSEFVSITNMLTRLDKIIHTCFHIFIHSRIRSVSHIWTNYCFALLLLSTRLLPIRGNRAAWRQELISRNHNYITFSIAAV